MIPPHESKTRATGILRSIAHRPTDGEPMREAREATAAVDRGIDVENRKAGKREITLLSAESWADACGELGVTLPWHFRRANLLVEGVDLAAAIGCIIRVGPAQIRIHGETKPCHIMEAQHTGLRDALKPQCRGGVHGEVLVGGTVRVGDRVVVEVADATGTVDPSVDLGC